MIHDPRVDDYIAKAAPFAQPILTHVRSLVHGALPEAEEGIKWGMPHFMVRGKNVVGMAAFGAHASIVIHYENQPGTEKGGGGMGSFGKLTSLADLPPDDAVIARIKAGYAALSQRKPRAKGAPKPDLPVPPELAAALAQAPEAQTAFDAFSPSHRREYVEWISQAKREDTRIRRVEQTIAWLREGKPRNWKYEKC